ncbi:MAG: hypothetical protein IJZ80_03510, partial [Clostridia bacterium]|nr:hypothetical protein [Clostridia bacterium]
MEMPLSPKRLHSLCETGISTHAAPAVLRDFGGFCRRPKQKRDGKSHPVSYIKKKSENERRTARCAYSLRTPCGLCALSCRVRGNLARKARRACATNR